MGATVAGPKHGRAVAQLVERTVRDRKAVGSSPASPTMFWTIS